MDALLGLLETIQGKFLVSSFRNTGLREMTRKQGWNTVEVRRSSSITHGNGKVVRDKIEVLTANYPIKNPERGCEE